MEAKLITINNKIIIVLINVLIISLLKILRIKNYQKLYCYKNTNQLNWNIMKQKRAKFMNQIKMYIYGMIKIFIMKMLN